MTPQQLEVETPSDLSFFLPERTAGHSRQHPRLTGAFSAIEPRLTKQQTTIRVALAGCGVVGGGLVRLLHESASAIGSRFGVRFELTRVLVRDVIRERHLPLEKRLFT